MTTDAETNFLFLAETLRSRWRFVEQFIKVLDDHNINYNFLALTRDIWALDYMPIQIDKGKFVQFRYDPDYLRNRRYKSTRTIPEHVCKSIGLETLSSPLRIDGGNIIKGQDWVIVTDKIFKENPSIKRNALIDEL